MKGRGALHDDKRHVYAAFGETSVPDWGKALRPQGKGRREMRRPFPDS